MALSKKAARRVAKFLREDSPLILSAIRSMLGGIRKAAGDNKSFQKSMKRIQKALTKQASRRIANIVNTKLSKKVS